MRILVFPVLTAAVAAGALAWTPTAAQAPGPPIRKAGWWEMTMQMSAPMAMTQRMHMCTDAATEAKVSALAAGPEAPGDCGAPDVRRTAQGWAFDSVCRAEGMTLTSSGVATGDFQSDYRIETTTRMAPAPMPQMAETRSVISARWLGECPAGRRAGDMVLPNGMVVNAAP